MLSCCLVANQLHNTLKLAQKVTFQKQYDVLDRTPKRNVEKRIKFMALPFLCISGQVIKSFCYTVIHLHNGIKNPVSNSLFIWSI